MKPVRSSAATSSQAERRLSRQAARRTPARRGGPLHACERAGSYQTPGATGSKPSQSENCGHYVTHSPGVGKTHLAISLALAAVESGRRVYYGTLASLVESLEQARAAGQLARRLRVLTHPALLLVDEIGYLPVSRDGAVLFFQLINARHEQASTVLTSNKGFEEWGAVLGDEVMAAALIDRLLHHCHIVNIRGNSYRMRAHQDLWRSMQRADGDASPALGRGT